MKIYLNLFSVIFFLFITVSCAKYSTIDLSKIDEPINIDELDFGMKQSQAYYHYMLANLYFYEGKLYKSLAEFKIAEELDPNSSLVKYDLGFNYLALGINQAAITKLNESIKLNPTNPLPYKTLGRLYTSFKNKKDIRYGKKLLLKAIDKDTNDYETYLYLAINSFYLNDIPLAEEYLDSSLSLNNKDERIYFYLGTIANQKEDYNLAEKYLKKSLEIKPSYYSAFTLLTQILEKNNKVDEVNRVYEEVIRNFPLSKEIFVNYGNFFYRQGTLDKALLQYQNAEILDISDLQIKYRIGLIYLEKKEYLKAIDVFKKINSLNPRYSGVNYYVALCYIKLENYEEAEKFLNVIVPSSDFYYDAVVQRSYIHLIKNNPQKSLEILESEYSENNENSVIVDFLGSVYRWLNRVGDSINLYKKFLKEKPDDETILYSLGVSYYYNDEVVKSITVMSEIKEKYPNNADAINFIGYTYAERGENLDYAEKLIFEAMKIRPNKGYIIDSLGWIYYQKGEFDKALEYLLQAVNLSPDDPEIMEHLGDTYLRKGKKDLALENYKKALDLLHSSKKLVPKEDNLKRVKEKIKKLELNEA